MRKDGGPLRWEEGRKGERAEVGGRRLEVGGNLCQSSKLNAERIEAEKK